GCCLLPATEPKAPALAKSAASKLSMGRGRAIGGITEVLLMIWVLSGWYRVLGWLFLNPTLYTQYLLLRYGCRRAGPYGVLDEALNGNLKTGLLGIIGVDRQRLPHQARVPATIVGDRHPVLGAVVDRVQPHRQLRIIHRRASHVECA